MAKILITGGSGLVGKAICKQLIALNHEVRILSRSPKSTPTIKSFFWDVESQQIDEIAFDGIEHVIHLAGTGIADSRWTEARKKDIIDSRINSMKLITAVVKRKNIKLKSFVGASAIGIYGMTTSEKIFSETDSGENDFLSHTCTQWENSYKEIASLCEKTCIIRLGVVLSVNGGALKRLLPLFKLGLGSAIGSGKQYMPWIHIEDLVSIFCEALFNPNFKGTYNAAANEQITNEEFSKQLAKSLSKPFFIPNVPSFLFKLLFGEMANMLLTGSRVNNEKLLNTGFIFKFPALSSALKDISTK